MKTMLLAALPLILITGCSKKGNEASYTMSLLNDGGLLGLNCGTSLGNYLIINGKMYVPKNLPDSLKHKWIADQDTLYIQYYIPTEKLKCFDDNGNPLQVDKVVITAIK